MSTTITIAVGALSRNRTFSDDTKASAALLKFYTAYNLGPATATNGEKLDAIINWLVKQVIDVSEQQYVEEQRAADLAAAKAIYGFDV